MKVVSSKRGVVWGTRRTSVHHPLHLPASTCWGVGPRTRVREGVLVHVGRFPGVVAAKHASNPIPSRNIWDASCRAGA